MAANSSIQNLKSGSHIHLMGICGTAMASLAGLLKDRGFKVTGSDLNPYPPMSTLLESLGINILKGYKKENLNPRPDFVVVGNVISASNEEAQELIKLEIPYTSLPKAMGEFIIAGRESFVISGTHGKTTTTSLMAWTQTQLGLKPGFLIGGIPKNFNQSFQNPQGDTFVIEGDEYDTAFFDKVPKFIHYRPKHVILTSVEFDHADIYKDLAAVKASFQKLLELIPVDGTFAYEASQENIRDLLPNCRAKKQISYGVGLGDLVALNVKYESAQTSFDVEYKGQSLGAFTTQMTGEYNVLNAMSVLAQAVMQDWDLNKVREAFASFGGVKRRQEILGEPNGILVIEDFAHHPTAVKETIKGIKSRYPKRKLFAVFEPRSATSRRKVFQQDYVQAFQQADEVFLAKAFDQSKIDESDRFSSEELIADLKKSGRSAGCYNNADEIVAALKGQSRSGDLILIMSNGGFDGIYQKLMKTL